MIADLKPYAEYKASNQAWIGPVPTHWSVLPNRAIFSEVKNRNHPDEEMLSVTITKGIIRQKALLASSSKKDSSNLNKSAYKLVCPRDIAYNKMRAWQGAIGVSDYRGIVSPAYVIMRLREDHNPRYFHHLYRTPHFAKEAERWSYGITSDMWSLRPEHFKMIYTPLPSAGEQAAIVRFLDYANRRIDFFIRAKKKVIALLNEQKQAIIHQAVTHGLDPNVPLKPSGIPWIEDIPKHWELYPLKKVLLKMDYGTSENVRGEGKIRVLTMGHIRDGNVLMPESGGLEVAPKGLLLETNDLLFNRTNSPDLVGKVGLFTGGVTDQVTFASYLVRLRVHPQHNPFWLNYLLNSHRFWAYARSQALVSLHQANLNSTRYGQMILPIPPRLEQDAIVDHLVMQTEGIDRAFKSTNREITLLREYRTRLIADVVTGKLDVREVVQNLPDEAAESGIIDEGEILAGDGEMEDGMSGEDGEL